MSADNPQRILVSGSQKWSDWNLLEVTLRELAVPGAVLMHNGREGVARMAGYIWREKFGLPVVVSKNDWAKHRKAAGYINNERMVLSGPDVVVSFILDEDKIASHLLGFAKQKSIPCREFFAVSGSDDDVTGEATEDTLRVDPFAAQIL